MATSALGLRLTAVILVLQAVPIWYLRPVVLSLAIIALLFPSAIRTPALWGAIAVLLAVWVIRTWPMADNHNYLFVYWTLAIFLALCSRQPAPTLAKSARWLVAAVFLWATVWKAILSPDYMDGRFYRVRLLTDQRFAQTVQVLGGLSADQLAAARGYLEPPPFGEPSLVSPALVEPPAVIRLATFLTWSTVGLEAAVALAFLLSWGRWTSAVRHGILLIFCAAAYAVAPVAGFGWLLIAMGVVQSPAEARRLRAIYVIVFLMLRFYMDIPWGGLLLRIGAGPL